VLILRLVFNALAREKLAARGITTREVEEVVASGPHVRSNPNARVPGSIYDWADQLSAIPDGRAPA
jgi:hypothetical protein